MVTRPLSRRREAALRAAPLSVPLGLTLDGAPPPGFQRFSQAVALSRRDFEPAAAELLSWRVHQRAGLAVEASDDVAQLGTVVQLRLGLGVASIRIPCRVIELIDEPKRRGFTYATLPGHPESGVERFLLERGHDETLRFSVTAVSAPGSLPTRLARPLARAIQEAFTRRYLRGLEN
ncbi:DUF1990 family protein [Brachybacterium paraconglomeratum]|uniref:DUF1990 family protein n=1 Tax=Brachybacterium paraconglomeratum TaxID=173362 RepID=UPI00223AD489|nr:DUF1990 domain-containing protein [Brachybacterium paraconglomeratum]MCT1438376.1 DUF1990 domain-containing protein [Brachybacterium paraconglomeratum]